VLAGSHLDSQPGGGRFDGVYGVVAALEVLTTLAAARRAPAGGHRLRGVDERGGLALRARHDGLRSLCRRAQPGSTCALRDAKGVSVADALDALHAAFPALRRRPLGFALAAYVEAHIEQGPILEAEGA
jgi:N-carbamoyl-L-amino-acid hydrolase